MKISMQNLAQEDQPRYKLELNGSPHLTNAELLAILINNGNQEYTALDLANILLNKIDNKLSNLGELNYKDIIDLKIKGIGKVKAITILAALELGIRRATEPKEIIIVDGSKQIANYLKEKYQYLEKEVFIVLLLNRANKIIREEVISKGGLTSTTADIRVILKLAISHKATAILVSHNHPSGNLTPSQEDLTLTKNIKAACVTVDIRFLDHIIVSRDGYFSFSEEKYL